MGLLINWRNNMWSDIICIVVFVIAAAPFVYAVFGQKE
jgi:hypothetical protein